MIVLLMGVSGCGKSTVGRALADAMHWPCLDADDFHPEANVAKMARGEPLTDDDRWPWLDRLAAEMRSLDVRRESAVVACSALKDAYRRRLLAAGEIHLVFLKGNHATIEPRLSARTGHYMPPSLLASQFAALEEPADAVVIDIRAPVAEQVAAIRAHLHLDRQVA